MKSQSAYTSSDTKDRLGDKLRQAGKAREDQWPAQRDRELQKAMKLKQSEQGNTPGEVEPKAARVFSRILCPVDFGESSLRALELAAALAVHHRAKLYALYVARSAADQWRQMPENGGENTLTTSAMLHEVAAKHLAGVRYECLATVGEPANKIVAFARGIEADLIVIGTPLRSTLSRLLLGSVTKAVLEKSSCPVLVTLSNGQSMLEAVTIPPQTREPTRKD
jgi:nucleotide-binding universal stress UspA family protein